MKVATLEPFALSRPFWEAVSQRSPLQHGSSESPVPWQWFSPLTEARKGPLRLFQVSVPSDTRWSSVYFLSLTLPPEGEVPIQRNRPQHMHIVTLLFVCGDQALFEETCKCHIDEWWARLTLCSILIVPHDVPIVKHCFWVDLTISKRA